jgi:peptidoglycan hydrolase CwlO-like protein
VRGSIDKKKVVSIEAGSNVVSERTKVWVLWLLVVGFGAIVSIFGNRMLDQIDRQEAAIHSMQETLASKGEQITSLQRDRDSADKSIERLQNQVERLQEQNADLRVELKGKK